jgi:glutaredoxin
VSEFGEPVTGRTDSTHKFLAVPERETREAPGTPPTTGVGGSLWLAPPSTGMSRTLYELDGCPYCEKVSDRLDDLGMDYESVPVPGLHSERNEVRAVSGQRQVPVLVDDERGVIMAESDRIVEYLNATYARAETEA